MSSAPYIRTGNMRHRADLQSKSESGDGGGGVSVSWATERKLWCHIRPLSGRQRMESMQRESSVTHEIYARYNADLTTEKRIVHDGTAYRIESLWSPHERKEFVHMQAVAGVAT